MNCSGVYMDSRSPTGTGMMWLTCWWEPRTVTSIILGDNVATDEITVACASP